MRVVVPMVSGSWPDAEPAIAWHDRIQPVGLHRPQVVQHGNNQRGARAILHHRDVSFRNELQIAWFQARIRNALPIDPLEGPLGVVMEFSGRTTTRWGERAPRPDLSNLIKALEDAGNGVLWKDDRDIMQTVASIRRWDREATPLVALWVWTLPAWPATGSAPADEPAREGSNPSAATLGDPGEAVPDRSRTRRPGSRVPSRSGA